MMHFAQDTSQLTTKANADNQINCLLETRVYPTFPGMAVWCYGKALFTAYSSTIWSSSFSQQLI